MGIKKNNPGCNCCDSIPVCECPINCGDDTSITVDSIEVVINVPDTIVVRTPFAGLNAFWTYTGVSAFNGTYYLTPDIVVNCERLDTADTFEILSRLNETGCTVDGNNCRVSCPSGTLTDESILLDLTATRQDHPSDTKYLVTAICRRAIGGSPTLFQLAGTMRCSQVNLVQTINLGSCSGFIQFGQAYGTAEPVNCE